MSLPAPLNSVHATTGWPAALRVRLGRREELAVALRPPPEALPASSCQAVPLRRAVQQRPALLEGRAVLGEDGLGLVLRSPGQQHGAGAVGEQLGDDPHALLRRLARPVDGLGHPLAQGAVVVDEGVTDIGERQSPQPAHDLVEVHRARPQFVQQGPQRGFVHRDMLPDAGHQ